MRYFDDQLLDFFVVSAGVMTDVGRSAHAIYLALAVSELLKQ